MPAAGWSKAAALAATGGPYQTVFGLPPEPWPDIPDGYVFGPEWALPGSIYTFDEASALERSAEHGHPLGWLEKTLIGFRRFIDGTGTWVMPMRYARAQVVASLTGGEQLIHSLALRPTDESVNVSGQVLHDLAVVLGGYFTDFMAPASVHANLSPGLVYHQINISYIQQTTGVAKDGSGGDQQTLVPTIQVDISPTVPGQALTPALPYEVALALTLQTDTRGPRTRGRIYLGGLASNIMGSNGLFDANAVGAIGAAFGNSIIEPLHSDTTWRLNVVSRRAATGREVQGIAVGVVPDSQRRRRNQLDENYAQAWGTPPGAIPPG